MVSVSRLPRLRKSGFCPDETLGQREILFGVAERQVPSAFFGLIMARNCCRDGVKKGGLLRFEVRVAQRMSGQTLSLVHMPSEAVPCGAISAIA